MTKSIYSKNKYSCKFSNTYSTPFLAIQGVKQGDSFSPALFNLFIEDKDHYGDKDTSKPASLDITEFNPFIRR